MKKNLLSTLAALALMTTPQARAWNYQDGDVLLIFRASSKNDIEFDLGNINQFTSLANGATLSVTNWNLNLVTNTFGADLTGVEVIAAATTSKTNVIANRSAWLSSADTTVPVDLTASAWQSKLWSPISGLGQAPVTYLLPTAGAAAYSINPDPNDYYHKASYDYIVSGGNYGSIAQLGGNADFTVQETVPGTFAFWQIQPSTANSKPPAAYVGSFTITADGGLTFTAGAPSPAILGIARSGNDNTVSFTTLGGGTFSLVYTNQLGGAVATWPVVSGPVPGDGNNTSLTHSSSDSAGFYSILRTP